MFQLIKEDKIIKILLYCLLQFLFLQTFHIQIIPKFLFPK